MSRIVKLLLPPILCVLSLLSLNKVFNDNFTLLPVIFGFVIGSFNWSAHRFKPIIGLLLSIVLSYIIFIISFFSLGVVAKIIDIIFKGTQYFMSDESKAMPALLISAYILAPILIFFAYKFLFHIPNTKFLYKVVTITIILLVLVYFFSTQYWHSSNESPTFSITNPYVIWQFVVALSIQVLLIHKENLERS